MKETSLLTIEKSVGEKMYKQMLLFFNKPRYCGMIKIATRRKNYGKNNTFFNQNFLEQGIEDSNLINDVCAPGRLKKNQEW